MTGEPLALFAELAKKLAQDHQFDIRGLEVRDGNEVLVTVATDDAHLSPHSIARILKRQTGGVLRRTFPELKKLPATWTNEYAATTVGEKENYE